MWGDDDWDAVVASYGLEAEESLQRVTGKGLLDVMSKEGLEW